MRTLGDLSLWIALLTAIWATIASFVGGARPRSASSRALIASGEQTALLASLSLMVASGALFTALVRRDFTIAYVAYNTSLNLPTAFALTAFWAAPAGSLLLFAWSASMVAAVVVLANRARRRMSTALVTGVLAFIVSGLVLALLAGSNPFAPFDGVTTDGRGLNPQLQHRWAAVHPPLVYLGFAASIAPFAYTIGALVMRRVDAHWLASSRRWMLLTWTALSIGLLVGMRWAYLEEGWGGFWTWDVVQNSALLPWLTCTVFLHTALLQERRPAIRPWNVLLSLAPMLFVLLGSYVSRSGAVASVHSFVTPGSGLPTHTSVWMLNLLLIALLASALVLITRRDTWRVPVALDDAGRRASGLAFDRDTMLRVGTWTLFAMAVVVLWGMLFPIMPLLLNRQPSTLAPGFYNGLARPLSVVALVALGLSAFARWRDNTAPARATHRKVAALLAHVGVIAVMFAVAGTFFTRQTTGLIRTGDVLALQDAFGTRWSFVSQGMSTYDEINRQVLGVSVSVARAGRPRGMLASVQRQYFDGNGDSVFEPTTETGVRSSLGQDVRLVFTGAPERDAATVRIEAQPLVSWLWIGGALIIVAGLVLFWPTDAAPEGEAETETEMSMTDSMDSAMDSAMDEAEALIAKARAAQRVCPDCGPCPEPNAKFCSNCGKSLPNICRHCGAALAKPDARFCSECGASQGTVT